MTPCVSLRLMILWKEDPMDAIIYTTTAGSTQRFA